MNQSGVNYSFLVLAANTPWVYALAQSLGVHGAVTAVRLHDWGNYARLKPQWPETESGVRRVSVTMPQGYAGTLELVFRPLMRRIVDREIAHLRARSGVEPLVICPYPFLAPWVRHIQGERLVYYNLDDYALYDPKRAARTTALEDELVQRAGLTICLSLHQAQMLRRRRPAQAQRIQHFPLGVVESFLNSAPVVAPHVSEVGYVGNLTDRVDWAFVREVARLMPETLFYFVGAATDHSAQRTRAFSLPNVIHEPPVPQADVPMHYWKYAVNWMPYDVRHPFNIASCPTKIMDALASGRPFVSTDIPEVRLYPNLVHVVSAPEDAVSKLHSLLHGNTTHDSSAQVNFARTQTWPHRARRLLDLLPNHRAVSARPVSRAANSLGSIDRDLQP